MTYYLHNNGVIREGSACPGEGLYCKPRPDVVIDSESVEQMERLAKAYYDLGDDWFEPGSKAMSVGAYRMQAVLRSLIAPEPEPDEKPGNLAEVLGRILDRLDRLEGKKS